MARLPILEYPDPQLRTRAAPVDAWSETLERLVEDMFETMYGSSAIGLAAPQVGVGVRVVVLDVSAGKNQPELFINPEILDERRVGMVEESCLSVPGIVGNVTRATRVRLRATDRAGAVYERALDDLAAVCASHEIDHLDGVLFVDRLSFFSRIRMRRTLRARERSLTEPRRSIGKEGYSKDERVSYDRPFRA
jgi:peptide deformylase